MRLLLTFLLLACTGILAAQEHQSDARRIVDGPAYQGYRIEPAPGSGASDWRSGNGRTGESSVDSGRPPVRESKSRTPEPRRSSGGSDGSWFSSPNLSWIGPLFEGVMWVLLAIALLFGAVLLVRALMGIKRRPRQPAKVKASKDSKPEPEEPPGDSPAATPEEVLDALAIARQEYEKALAARDFSRAALLAYRIFWLEAGWLGCVEESDVRTWRDAVRMVNRPEKRQQVRDLLRMIEMIRYSHHAPDQNEFEDWRRQLSQINAREVLE